MRAENVHAASERFFTDHKHAQVLSAVDGIYLVACFQRFPDFCKTAVACSFSKLHCFHNELTFCLGSGKDLTIAFVEFVQLLFFFIV